MGYTRVFSYGGRAWVCDFYKATCTWLQSKTYSNTQRSIKKYNKKFLPFVWLPRRALSHPLQSVPSDKTSVTSINNTNIPQSNFQLQLTMHLKAVV